jgi:hypothetical protein
MRSRPETIREYGRALAQMAGKKLAGKTVIRKQKPPAHADG